MDITESKQTEKELKESDNRFQQLFNQAPLGYQSLDINGNFLEVNQKWLEMLGYEREEVIGKWFGDFLTPMYQDGFRKRFPIFKAQGHIHSEFEMQHKNGSILFIAFEGRIGSDLKGNFKQTHCILQDITESKRANEALIKSREDFLDLFDNAPIGYHEIDAGGRIVRMNQTELNMLGYTLGELVGKQFWSIITEEKVSGKAIVAKLSGEYVPIDFFEREFRKKDGTMLSVLLKDKIFKDKDGHITGIRTTVQNITERKKADNALKESEEKYRRITDNIIDVVWTSDLQLNINYVSPSVRKLLGLTEQEHINRSLAEKFPPESLAKLQQIFKEEYEKEGNPAFDKNHSRCIEVQYYKKDGTLIWAEINVSIIRNEFGVGVGLQGMTRDISDRKKAEEASRESEEIFRNTFENSAVGKSITSIEGELKTNTAFCQILGYSESELSTVNWRKITHLDDIESNSKIVEDLLKGVETSKRWEKRYIHKNGDIVWVDITTTLHRNGLGKPLFFITEIIDINDRKNAESDMQLNARRLNALVNILQYPIDSVQHYLDFALDQSIEMTSSKLGYIYFYSEEKKEFVLNSWSKEVMKECEIREKQTVYQLEKTGLWGEAVRQRKPIVVNDFQSHHPLKKGQPEGHAQLKNYLTIPVFRNKEIVAVIAVANKGTDYNDSDLKQLSVLMDIVWNTLEKKQAETALKQSEEKFSKAFKSSPDLIMLTEFESGRIVEVNERLFEITGYNEEEFIGKTTNEIHLWSYPEDRERFKNLLRHDGFVHNMEAKLSIKSGELRDNLVSAEIIELQNGKFILGVNRDITELKKVEETLRSSQNLLSETEKLGNVGGWEFYYDSDKLNWTEETFSIHELDNKKELGLDYAISFYTPDSTPIIKINIQNAIEQGQPFDLELEIITAKGNHRHVHTIGKPDKEHRRIYGFFQDITERKQADIALIESEEKFKKAFMTSPDAVNITRSSDGMYVSVSEGFTNMLGYTEEETVGRTSMEMDIWFDVEDRNKLVNGLKENGFVKNLLAQFKKKNGETIYGLMSANVIELNGVKQILSITRDVTEIKKTEFALQKSEEQLRLSTELANVAVWEFDFRTDSMSRSNNHDKLYGLEPQDEWKFETFIRATHPDDRELSNTIIQNSASIGGSDYYKFDFRVIYPDESIHWLMVTGQVVQRDNSGKGLVVRGTLIDITERKMAELALFENEKLLQEVTDNSASLIYALDTEGRFTFLNKSLEKVFGQNRDSLIGKKREDFMPLEIAEVHHANDLKVIETMQPITIEEENIDTDGKHTYLSVKFPLVDLEGNLIGVSGISTDITERKRSEERIIKLSRVNLVLSNVNQSIVHSRDKFELFNQVCKIAIEDGKLRMAWIGIINPQTNKVDVVASYGFVNGYLDSIDIDLNNPTRSNGPSGVSIKTAQHVYSNNIKTDDAMLPWREKALNRGYNSSISLPLFLAGKVIGSFTLYSDKENYFNMEEIDLLDKLAMNISFAMDFLENETERKNAEDYLRESKSKLDAALASTTDAIFITDAEGNYIEYNDAFVKFQRFITRENIPQSFTQFGEIIKVYYPNGEVTPTDMWAIPRALRGETATNVEYKLKRKDTDESWIGSYSFSPILDDKGAIVGSVVVARDVTELKIAEKILLESERRFRELLSSVKLLSVILDMDGNIVFCNDYLLNLTKWEKDDILGKNWFENFLPKEVIENVIGVFKKIDKEGIVITNYENSIVNKDGKQLLIEWNNTALYDENGKINGVASLGVDITERKKAEKALKESEEKLSALFASMTEMVVLHELIFDHQGNPINYRIIDCNNAFSKNTGIQKKDAIGKLATEVYATDVPPYFEEYSHVAISGESMEYKTYYAPMDKHFLISAVSPSKNKFATITSDISEIEQIQAEIKVKNKQLENYIYAASHDLRSPLVNIQGFSQRLQKQTKEIKETLAQIEMDEGLMTSLTKLTNDAIPNTLNFILSNVNKMDSLINALLQISRTGRITMVISKIDMNRLFKTIVDHTGFEIAEMSAKVTIDDLPECFGDENQLNQLFSNIIGNALKYRNLKRKLEIKISAKANYNKVIYCITDNGIGIAQQNLEKIWNVFYRVDTFSQESGDGIGLSLVRTIADKHKGKVWAESEEGIGSRFYVELQSNKFEE